MKQERTGRYSLRCLMMFVTSATVAFGILATSPGMGILLLAVTLLAGLRAFSLLERQRELGHSSEAGEQMWLLACSFAFVILVMTAPVGTGTIGFLLGRQLASAPQVGSGYVSAGIWTGLYAGFGLGVVVGLCFGFRALRCWLINAEFRDGTSVRTAETSIVSSRRLEGHSLAWLMMLLASTAVAPGASTCALGMGSLLGVVPILFWLRLAEVAHHRHRHCRMEFYHFLQSFGVALTLVAFIGFVAIVAFLLGYAASPGTVTT